MNLLKKPYIHVPAIMLVGFLIYSNTFNAPFVFDDRYYIVNNPAIKDFQYFLEPSKVSHLITIAPNFRYAFITRIAGYFTFALNYRIHGLDVSGYHFFNLLVHIINAVLIYFLVRSLFKSPFFSNLTSAYIPHDFLTHNLFAFFASLLFLIHPIQTQAVTYITQRFASLATLFFLLSLLTYIKSRLSNTNTARYVLYCLSVTTAVLAMLVKEISFTLPIIILLCELLFFKGENKKRVILLLPFALTMLIIPAALVIAEGSLSVSAMAESMRILASTHTQTTPRWDYLFTQFRVIVTYIRLLVLPINQNIDYNYPVYHSFFDAPVFFSFVFLMLLCSLCIYLFYRSKDVNIAGRDSLRLASFGIIWFFTTLSVESSLIPIADVIFEHRLYLPSVGFVITVTAAVSIIFHKMKDMRAVRFIIILGISVLFILAAATYRRNLIWQNTTLLWEDVIKKSPLKARGHNNLGVKYHAEGRFQEAIEQYRTAILLSPENAEYHYNLGLAYGEVNRLDESLEESQTAIRLKPDYAESFSSRGIIYIKKGRLDLASEAFAEAARLNPDDIKIRRNLVLALLQQGRLDEAAAQYRAVLQRYPGDAAVLQFMREIEPSETAVGKK